MRDIFEDIFAKPAARPDGGGAAHHAAAAAARFYQRTAAPAKSERRGGFPVLLDGRPVRTPARQPLAAPARALARRSPPNGRRSARSSIRRRCRSRGSPTRSSTASRAAPAPVAAEVEKYLGSDLSVLSRAPSPDGLVARQRQHWDPVLAWARDALGARFVLAEGVMYVAQPDEAIAAARAAIPAANDAREPGGSARSTSSPR